jgi:hypothetical protein
MLPRIPFPHIKPAMLTSFFLQYITWLAQGVKAWTMKSSATRADPITEIAARPIPQEPMYIITNLGISNGFGTVDVEHLTFPAKMRIDWIRVYQPKDQVNIGCSPKDFPTAEYIEKCVISLRDDLGGP